MWILDMSNLQLSRMKIAADTANILVKLFFIAFLLTLRLVISSIPATERASMQLKQGFLLGPPLFLTKKRSQCPFL